MADTDEGARAFVAEYGWRFPSIVDEGRERAGRLGAVYQPETILVDAEGRIAGRHVGEGDAAAWDALAAGL